MPDYSKAKIYRVFCGDDEYIGSTIRPLSERMAGHRSDFKKGGAKCSSRVIFEKHGIENVKIELIEEFPCENKEQLCKREGEIQRERACVNHYIAGRTRSEYLNDHLEEVRKKTRQYYLDHAEEVREYNRQYYLDHAEEHRERARQYYLDHAEELKEWNRQYRLRKKAGV